MAHVEDWSDGDFDLEHTELRTDHTSLQDVHDVAHADHDAEPNWDEDFPQDNLDDGSDEQTDTIKLSTAASSALKRMLEASKASAAATTAAASARSFTLHDDFDDQLRPPALDLDRISQYSDGFPRRDDRAGSTASLSTSASTSSRSMMGLSTDLTDPDSPHSKSDAHHRSRASSRSSGRIRSDQDVSFSEGDDNVEMDFDLEPDMNNLSLCSSLSRARSNTSLSQVSRDVWDDDSAFSTAPPTSTTHTSSTSLHPPASSDPPPSTKSVSGESDADDEHEDMLDGLDLEGSIFAKPSKASSATAVDVKAKLEAMLDLKRSGHPTASAPNHAQAGDSDAAIAAGLIIDDDFDLSTSRIAARNLPVRTYSTRSSSRLGVETAAGPGDDRHHPARTASQHGDIGPAQPLVTRSENRGSARNRLRFKRSTSDLHTHLSGSTASNAAPPSSSHRSSQNRGSQLTRKRSLPSMRTSPPANTPSSTGLPSANTSALPFRQRHNSGTSAASPSSRFRNKGGASRLTDSTAASRARAAEAADQLARLQRDVNAPARPSTPVSFNARPMHQPASRISVNTRSKARSNLERRSSSGENQPVARLLKRSVQYGNGAELDGIDDLPSAASPVVQSPRVSASSDKLNKSRTSAAQSPSGSVQPQGNQQKRGGRRGKRGKPALIRSLGAGASPAPKLVKGMRWNPQALRWEGNEDVLRDFDQVIQSSTRPALISQMTGSSTSSALNQAAGYSSPLSPESSTLMGKIASGARVVGDMLFDPVQMRWVHKSGDEEEDVFAEFDEPHEDGDDSHDASGSKLVVDGDNTVRARRTKSIEAFSRSSNPWTRLSDKHRSSSPAPDHDANERSVDRKNDQAIRKALSKGAFAPSVGIDRNLWDACVQAEKRHAIEVDGCLTQPSGSRYRGRTRSHTSDRAMTMDEIYRPRPHLYYLEKIAKSIVKPESRS
ncbi:hypothetical protein PHSY_005045 [Pseudozyma hubeiensis SY62]|uniref:Uncharacterized protein n=1 Tax=Pseudozyma hubeiensis (strain SY62) TaxID=1305764 RepID=R9P7Z7_PSEHS|nr:hypothetical protein PHSY_005045 [Pseudozyma hubeiensis SY62]GAC97459.1 hypothetical protein PHSY_005045 [Pseudozyma hubeiensis SY62]